MVVLYLTHPTAQLYQINVTQWWKLTTYTHGIMLCYVPHQELDHEHGKIATGSCSFCIYWCWAHEWFWVALPVLISTPFQGMPSALKSSQTIFSYLSQKMEIAVELNWEKHNSNTIELGVCLSATRHIDLGLFGIND